MVERFYIIFHYCFLTWRDQVNMLYISVVYLTLWNGNLSLTLSCTFTKNFISADNQCSNMYSAGLAKKITEKTILEETIRNN